MAYVSYNKDSNTYDFDAATKVTDGGIDYLDLPVGAGGTKMITRAYADDALAACAEVADYTNESRYNFWSDVIGKMDELSIT